MPDIFYRIANGYIVMGINSRRIVDPLTMDEELCEAMLHRANTQPEILAALRPFAFAAHPNDFTLGDDGEVSEVLVCDKDVQRARAALKVAGDG